MQKQRLSAAEQKNLAELARQIRIDCVLMTNRGQSGHVGSMLSMADITAVLYGHVLHVDPQNPRLEARDRFILSKGHAGGAIYAALAARGFFPHDWLKTYYQDDGKLSGHISHHVPGVEFSTGSLGHGLPVAAGMALSARVAGKKHRVFCLMSDGDINEGSSWEAIMFANQQKLDNLVGIIDCNRIQALGMTEDVLNLEPLDQKLTEFGWAVRTVDGHNIADLLDVFADLPFQTGKPSMVIARTIKSKGIPELEDTVASHYGYLPDDKVAAVLEGLKGDQK